MVPSVLRQCCIECGHTELLHEIPDRAYSGYQRGDYFTLTLFPLPPNAHQSDYGRVIFLSVRVGRGMIYDYLHSIIVAMLSYID